MACKSLNKIKLDDIGTEMLSITVGDGEKALLQKSTDRFSKLIAYEEGKKGCIVLKSEDPEIFKMFYDWLYTDNIAKPPSHIPIKTMPSQAEIQRLETDLRARFDAQEQKLVDLYCFAEKNEITHLMNRAIDTIQDGFYEYGTCFGPGLVRRIWQNTKKGSKLRELCVGANVIHTDRGCEQLRLELISTCITVQGFMPDMMKWISRNFVMFSRRQSEGFDIKNHKQGFSMFNRKKLCPCHFHTHTSGEAHKGHKKCTVPYNNCGHGDENNGADELDIPGCAPS